jgi:hypothetical protein
VCAVPGGGPAKQATTAPAPAFGAPFGAGAGLFGNPTAAGGAAQPAAATPEFSAKHVNFFTDEHFQPLVPEGQPQPRRPSGVHARPEIVERYMEYPQPHTYYTVVLDRTKHAVLNSFGQSDGQRLLEVVPRPGPDNLFQMLAVFAIELKVRPDCALCIEGVYF